MLGSIPCLLMPWHGVAIEKGWVWSGSARRRITVVPRRAKSPSADTFPQMRGYSRPANRCITLPPYHEMPGGEYKPSLCSICQQSLWARIVSDPRVENEFPIFGSNVKFVFDDRKVSCYFIRESDQTNHSFTRNHSSFFYPTRQELWAEIAVFIHTGDWNTAA